MEVKKHRLKAEGKRRGENRRKLSERKGTECKLKKHRLKANTKQSRERKGRGVENSYEN